MYSVHDLRDIESNDIEIITIDGEGPRVFMALWGEEQEGGHAADAITLLAMGTTQESLLASLRSLIKAKDFEKSQFFNAHTAYHLLDGQETLRGSDFNTELIILSAPVDMPLNLRLHLIQELKEENSLEVPSFR